MNETFDAYHRWLGIPPQEQPANHYRLLGLSLFESDPEVVRDAAERQIAHVRRYELGKHRDLSQLVINELAGAKACLLDETKKADYDHGLRQQMEPQQDVPPPAPAIPPSPPAPDRQHEATHAVATPRPAPLDVRVPRSGQSVIRDRARKNSWKSPSMVFGIFLGGLSLITAGFLYISSRERGPHEQKAPAAIQPSTPPVKADNKTAAPSQPPKAEPLPEQPRLESKNQPDVAKPRPKQPPLDSKNQPAAEPKLAQDSASAMTRNAQAPEDAALLMTFDEGTFFEKDGVTYVRDLSGEENHGKSVGGEYSPDGKIGGGLMCEGNGVQLSKPLLNRQPEYTFACWILASPGKDGSIYWEGDDYGNVVAMVDLKEDGSMNINMWNVWKRPEWWLEPQTPAEVLPFREWVFLAVRVQDGGVASGNAQLTINDTDYDIQSQMVQAITRTTTGFLGREWKGILDEVSFYQRALTDEEIQSFHQTGLRGQSVESVKNDETSTPSRADKSKPRPQKIEQGTTKPTAKPSPAVAPATETSTRRDGKPVITEVAVAPTTLANGGTFTFTITASSDAPVNWVNRSFHGPSGTISGGGSGVRFTEVSSGVWKYSRTYAVSEWEPSGRYFFKGISVHNEAKLTSDPWAGEVVVTVSNDRPRTKPVITDVTVTPDTLTGGGTIKLTITVSSDAPVNWLSRSFIGPSGTISGGGSGVRFEEISSGVWRYSRTRSISEWAPSGRYYFKGISVCNEAKLTSDEWKGDLSVTVENKSG